MNRSLSLDSDLINQNPQAVLVKILSCLPAGTPKATLRWWVHSAPLSNVSIRYFCFIQGGIVGRE